MTGNDIRKRIKENSLKIWEVAMECNISEPQFYRWLRNPGEKSKTIDLAIDNLIAERNSREE